MSNHLVRVLKDSQRTISSSSTEAEYKALSDGAQEGVYLKRLIEELEQHKILPTKLQCKSLQITHNLSVAATPTTRSSPTL